MKKRSREKPAIQLGQMLLLQEKMQIHMNRYANADVDHCCTDCSRLWKLVTPIFTFVFLCEKTKSQRKEWCANSTVLLEYNVSVTGTKRCGYNVAHCRCMTPVAEPFLKTGLGKFYLCTCTHSTLLLWCCYVSY